jgi:hypothetical protein
MGAGVVPAMSSGRSTSCCEAVLRSETATERPLASAPAGEADPLACRALAARAADRAARRSWAAECRSQAAARLAAPGPQPARPFAAARRPMAPQLSPFCADSLLAGCRVLVTLLRWSVDRTDLPARRGRRGGVRPSYRARAGRPRRRAAPAAAASMLFLGAESPRSAARGRTCWVLGRVLLGAQAQQRAPAHVGTPAESPSVPLPGHERERGSHHPLSWRPRSRGGCAASDGRHFHPARGDACLRRGSRSLALALPAGVTCLPFRHRSRANGLVAQCQDAVKSLPGRTTSPARRPTNTRAKRALPTRPPRT